MCSLYFVVCTNVQSFKVLYLYVIPIAAATNQCTMYNAQGTRRRLKKLLLEYIDFGHIKLMEKFQQEQHLFHLSIYKQV